MTSVKNFGTPADALTNATRFRPPSVGNQNDVSLSIAAVSAIETGAAAATPTSVQGPGWYSFASSVAFNIVFGPTNAITNPANNSAFPAGVHSFYLTDQMGFAEVMPVATGGMTWWKSSYGRE